jgi:alpha-tubulin suppressor-like RCC1 family protein
LVAALSAALALTFAAPATAATVITPSSGPATGGTTVTLAAATLGFTQIAQATTTGYGLSGDGHIYAWGTNFNDELGGGSGAPTTTTTPVRVLQGAIPSDVTITQLAAGWNGGYALASNGRVYSWGANVRGELGDGTTTNRNQPVAVDLSALPADVHVTQLAAGDLNAYALGSDGHVYAWGLGNDGEIGNGSTSDQHSPVAVTMSGLPAGVTFTQIASGAVTAYALGTDGRLYSWGYGLQGQLGNGGTAQQDTPAAISAGAIPVGVKITQAAGGQESGYALGDDGNVYAWGDNQFGDLGDGSTTAATVPVKVAAGDIPAGLKMTAITAGSSSGYALASDGHVYAWGNGGNGQLGNGLGADTTSPVLVSAGEIPSDVLITHISGGYHSAIALGSDNRVYGWGDNGGDLADGTNDQRLTPVLGANAKISAVTFGGTAGTGVVDPPGVTTVVTPAHAAGVVAVAVTGSLDGGTTAGAATSRTLPAAFTFLPTLAVTGTVMPWWLLAVGCAAILVGALALSRTGHRQPSA